MTIVSAVNAIIEKMPPGRIFGYSDLSPAKKTPSVVMRILSQMVMDKKIMRFSKNKYYIPELGIISKKILKPSSSEILRSILFEGKKQVGYITGSALYNRLGLTTQFPMTITVALEKRKANLDYGATQIKFVTARAPINNRDIQLLQYLDVIRNFKKVQDANDDQVLIEISRMLKSLSGDEIKKIQRLAINYYTPATVAVLGLLLSKNKSAILLITKMHLNPVTQYNLGLSDRYWSSKEEWFIT